MSSGWLSMIPDFVHSEGCPVGRLPPGVYPCSEITLRTRLLEELPDSRRRAAWGERIHEYLREVERLGLAGDVWIAGAFVTTAPEPTGCRLAHFCDAAKLNDLDEDGRAYLRSAVEGALAADGEPLEVIVIPEHPAEDERGAELTEDGRDSLLAEFGRTPPMGRAGRRFKMGFIKLSLAAADGPEPDAEKA